MSHFHRTTPISSHTGVSTRRSTPRLLPYHICGFPASRSLELKTDRFEQQCSQNYTTFRAKSREHWPIEAAHGGCNLQDLKKLPFYRSSETITTPGSQDTPTFARCWSTSLSCTHKFLSTPRLFSSMHFPQKFPLGVCSCDWGRHERAEEALRTERPTLTHKDFYEDSHASVRRGKGSSRVSVPQNVVSTFAQRFVDCLKSQANTAAPARRVQNVRIRRTKTDADSEVPGHSQRQRSPRPDRLSPALRPETRRPPPSATSGIEGKRTRGATSTPGLSASARGLATLGDWRNWRRNSTPMTKPLPERLCYSRPPRERLLRCFRQEKRDSKPIRAKEEEGLQRRRPQGPKKVETGDVGGVCTARARERRLRVGPFRSADSAAAVLRRAAGEEGSRRREDTPNTWSGASERPDAGDSRRGTANSAGQRERGARGSFDTPASAFTNGRKGQ